MWRKRLHEFEKKKRDLLRGKKGSLSELGGNGLESKDFCNP